VNFSEEFERADEPVAQDLELPDLNSEPVEPAVVEETEMQPILQAAVSEESDLFASDLEEAAYFAEQGLIDEARGVYEGIISQKPDHALALEKLAELEGTIPAKSGKSRPAPVELLEDEIEPEIEVKAEVRSKSSERVLK